jgi:hypothetical protein
MNTDFTNFTGISLAYFPCSCQGVYVAIIAVRDVFGNDGPRVLAGFPVPNMLMSLLRERAAGQLRNLLPWPSRRDRAGSRASPGTRRSPERFPSDFMFQLVSQEQACLRSQIVTPKSGRGGRG